MGVIFQALDPRLQREVAIKCLAPQFNSDESIRQRFIAEARAASKLDHPNICTIYDVGETSEGQMYIAMAYYSGQTLDRTLQAPPLDVIDASHIVCQIARGLQAAHRHNIVHRDIKPANIMLTAAGGVKILDFGIAKTQGMSLTGTGMCIGTFAYMAPEQMQGEVVDARADIWSLGAVYFEMVTGVRAFNGDFQQMREVLADPQSPLPMPVVQILTRCLQVERHLRYTDADSLAHALEAFVNGGAAISTAQGSVERTVIRSVSAQPPPTSIDAQALATLTTSLTHHIGPIAPVLVKKMAAKTNNMDELVEQLVQNIDNPAAREALQRALRNTVTGEQTSQLSVSDSGLTAQQLSYVEQVLTPIIGPISGALVKRLGKSCINLDQLREKLHEYLTDEDHRRLLDKKLLTCPGQPSASSNEH